MSQTNHDEKTTVGKDKKILLLLAVVFLLPFTVASTLHLLNIRPGGKSFGNLVLPIVELNIPAFTEVNGKAFEQSKWGKIWNVIMIDAANCPTVCEQNVDKLDRVHRSLYKEEDRVQRILMLKNNVDVERVQQLQQKYPGLIVLSVGDESQNSFVAQFEQVAPQGSIYLVDPLNNLMMYYPMDVEPKALRADIKKLLKNSWGG